MTKTASYGTNDGIEVMRKAGRNLGNNNHAIDVCPSSNTNIITVSPTLDTSQYVTGDLLANPTEIPLALDDVRMTGILHSVAVLDKSDQAIAFDILIFDQTITTGTLNNAFSPSDADMANCLGAINVPAAGFFDCANSQLNFIGNIGMVVKSTTTSLYFVLVSRGTATYAANGIQIKFGFLSD